MRDPLPSWLSEIAEPARWEFEPPSLPDADALELIARPATMNKNLFGTRPCLTGEIGQTDKKVAIALWSNHWQMLTSR